MKEETKKIKKLGRQSGGGICLYSQQPRIKAGRSQKIAGVSVV